MTSRIAKGFSLCTAIVGVLCLVTGIGIAICAWVLNGQLPSGFYYEGSNGSSGTIAIGNYWWGGMIYILPGILGILAGCTRNVPAMVLYLIFNLICCICSLVVVVLCALVLLVWASIDYMLQGGGGNCQDVGVGVCRCTDYEGGYFTLYGGNCTVFTNIQVIIGAMVSMAALSSLLSFISSYVSCCALCNQESTDVVNVIISGGGGVYQPPPVVVNNTTNMQNVGGYPPHHMNSGYPPPAYAPQTGFPPQGIHNAPGNNDASAMPYSTSDKINLVNSEYR